MMTYSKLLKLSVLGLSSAFILTACMTPAPSYAPTPERNQVKVAETIERLELYTRPNGLELSARDQFAVGEFLDAYRQSGDGPIFVNMPSGGKNGLGTQQAATTLKTMMAQVGINPVAMQMGEHQTLHNAPAPVVVSYRTLKTVPKDCRFMDDLRQTYNNQPYQSFGCSHTANLAAMVADPRQFLEPYNSTTPNSQRRTVVYDKYIQGELTGSERSPDQTATLDDE